MAKPKALTLAQRFGLQDDDLKNHSHDEIMKWLDAHLRKDFVQLFTKSSEWQPEDLFPDGLSSTIDIEPAKLPYKPNIEMVSLDWEYAIKNNDYLIGFADMMLKYKVPKLEKVEGKYIEYWRDRRIFFEVKTKIPSIGELLRQINMYRGYCKPMDAWYVVSPDASSSTTLASQGVKFLLYDPQIPF